MAHIHDAALAGFSREAQTYARGRPEYPQAILRWLASTLALAPGAVAVDLGAGTGKFTRLLAQTGAEVIAVEPVDAMRDELSAKLPKFKALAGSAEAIPLETGSVDAVVCAQAFHWFATVNALAEIRRVLKPTGRLGLVWNVRDESIGWVAEITRIITPYEGDAPRLHTGAWRAPFAAGLFSAPEMTAWKHQHVGTAREVIVDRFMSSSVIAALQTREKAGVKSALEALIASHPDLAGHESVAFPYRAEAYWCAPHQTA